MEHPMRPEQIKEYAEATEKYLTGISEELWIFDADVAQPLPYTDHLVAEVTHIFTHVLMNKMWEKQEKEDMANEEREDDAFRVGSKLHELIKDFTDIDTHTLFNN